MEERKKSTKQNVLLSDGGEISHRLSIDNNSPETLLKTSDKRNDHLESYWHWSNLVDLYMYFREPLPIPK